MSYESTFHIHKMDDNLWQIEYYRDAILLETVVVKKQEEIGQACDNLYNKYTGSTLPGIGGNMSNVEMC